MTQKNTRFINNEDSMFEMQMLDNPEEVLQQVMDEVSGVVAFLETEYNADYSDFQNYLRLGNSRALTKLANLWDEIDSDIFDHYRRDTLMGFELDAWRNTLNEWKQLLFAQMKQFVHEVYHEQFDPAFAAQQRAAA